MLGNEFSPYKPQAVIALTELPRLLSLTGTGEIRTNLVHQYTRVLETGKCSKCQEISGPLHYFQHL